MKETANSFLDYKEHIVFVRIKENVDITVSSMKEQYNEQAKLVGTDTYAVLVDGTKNANVPVETREFMAKHNPKNRIATAILTNNNLATTIIGNFYLKFHKPKNPTKLFQKESDAINWLKTQLYSQSAV